MSADIADKILSSDWSVSLNVCSDWLDEPFKRRISTLYTHTHTHTHPEQPLLNCLFLEYNTNDIHDIKQFIPSKLKKNIF